MRTFQVKNAKSMTFHRMKKEWKEERKIQLEHLEITKDLKDTSTKKNIFSIKKDEKNDGTNSTAL